VKILRLLFTASNVKESIKTNSDSKLLLFFEKLFILLSLQEKKIRKSPIESKKLTVFKFIIVTREI
jgi:hypothetical protein